MLVMDECVQALQERRGVQVLAAAELVGHPVLPRIIEVYHRGDRIDPETVDVVALEPEYGIRQQELRDLPPGEIER
jgi:hypothetical protein